MTITVDVMDAVDRALVGALAWSLEVNPHRTVYLSAADYIREQRIGCTAEELVSMVVADTIYELTVYPRNPVGSHTFVAATLAGVLKRWADSWEAAK